MSHSHTPPVPKDNQSPYPIHEPPHPHAASAPTDRRVAKTSDKHDGNRSLAIGAAIGIGAAALALAAGVFMLEERGKSKGKKPKPGHKAKHKGEGKPKPKPDHDAKHAA